MSTQPSPHPVGAALAIVVLLLCPAAFGCKPMRVRGGPIDRARLHDGTYRGSAKHFDQATVTIEVVERRVTHVSLDAFEATRYGQPARQIIPARIMQQQSTKVDAVSGATEASNVIMNAAQDAVEKAYAKASPLVPLRSPSP